MSLLLASLFFLASTSLMAGSALAEEGCNLTGTWNSSFGKLQLQQDGSKLTGKYTKDSENFFEQLTGTIEGTVSDGKAAWTWSQNDKANGHGEWTVSPSCRALDGKWGRTKDLELGNWFATRAR